MKRQESDGKVEYLLSNGDQELEITIERGGEKTHDFAHIKSEQLDFSSALGEPSENSRQENLEELGEELDLEFGEKAVLVALFRHDFSVKLDNAYLKTGSSWGQETLYPLEYHSDNEEDEN